MNSLDKLFYKIKKNNNMRTPISDYEYAVHKAHASQM